MDILEKARQHFPLETTGQPFQTHELQRIKVVREMADEIERLREAAKDRPKVRPKDRPNEAADEIERLRLDMALTREALEKINTLLGKNIHIKERAKEARSILLDILYPDRHDDK